MNKELLDLKNIALSGKNLIEASAGTGKTYSIAILVIRTIIDNTFEKSIKEILVVTFTNAATAELRDRIRKFIYSTYLYLNDGNCNDPVIVEIIDNALKIDSKQSILSKIKNALLLIDEAPIFTIHGFCNRVLTEFPFDTQQPFIADDNKDVDPLIESAVYSFWRKNITILPLDLLQRLNLKGLENSLKLSIRNVINRKSFVIPEYLINQKVSNYIAENFNNILFKDFDEKFEQLKNLWENNKLEILEELAAKKIKNKPENRFAKWPDDFYSFFENFKEKSESTQYVIDVEGYFFDDVFELIDIQNKIDDIIFNIENLIIKSFLDEYLPEIESKIKDNNIITYDGLIIKLKDVIERSNEEFLNTLRKKYKTVFIDEFQDTDYNQFYIFDRLFLQNESSVVYLIGDPKQSIYSFRNADIDCYLLAKNKVDKIYNMSVNFRSSAAMVAALNEFYTTMPSKEMFGFKPSDEQYIEYEEIKANKNIEWHKDGVRQDSVLTFLNYSNKTLSLDNLINNVTEILSPASNYSFYDVENNKHTKILPEHIGILVRRKSDGTDIKNRLTKLGIPCIQMFEGKIFETIETLQIIYILESFLTPHLANIKKAIYFSFLNYIPEYNIFNNGKEIDENTISTYYSSYIELVEENKTYEALYAFLEDFGVRSYFSKNEKYAPILAHIEQILQAINNYQYQKKSSTTEVIKWLHDHYTKKISKDDEYLLSLESDESAVKIITVHKSKGLEYPVTFLFGDFDYTINSDIVEYKEKNAFNILFSHKDYISKDILNSVNEKKLQENRRLLYVALTRAVYRTFYFCSFSEKHQLHSVLEKIKRSHPNYCDVKENEEIILKDIYIDKKELTLNTAELNFENLSNFASNVIMTSYTGLSQYHKHNVGQNNIHQSENDDYNEIDQFLFKELPKGAYLGTVMHELFQELDFESFKIENEFKNTRWLYLESVKNLKYLLGEKFNEELLYASLGQIFNATLIDSYAQKTFYLSSISSLKCLNELEFNFRLSISSTRTVTEYLNQLNAFSHFSESEISGLMNGFIDLIFEYDGRYYILDWKTNHLGNSIENYIPEALYSAMTDNNYHLQYIIYTFALHIYLKERIGDYNYEKHFGGVFYLFIRGCRIESNTGVFFNRPEYETLLFLENTIH